MLFLRGSEKSIPNAPSNVPRGGGWPQASLRIVALPSEPDWLEISVTPALPDGIAFIRRLFPERGYRECPEAESGWRLLAQAVALEEPVIAVGPFMMLVSRRHPWQHLVAMYAISSAIWLQPDVFVLHAASVGIAGKGVLLSGAKGAGKTTLALSFAAVDTHFSGMSGRPFRRCRASCYPCGARLRSGLAPIRTASMNTCASTHATWKL